MTLSKDQILATLSIDAYNRGYGAGITDSANDEQNGRWPPNRAR